MILITEEYRELQRDLHARYDYGKGVDSKDCDRIVRGFLPLGGSVLDYGCGQGHLGRLMRPDYDVREYDPAIPGKDAQPEPADVVVCADVLEHIEPELLDDVLAHIRDLTQIRAVLVIATGPSAKLMADGRAAHLIVENGEWWRDKLSAFFDIRHFEDRSADGKGVLAVVDLKSLA